MKKSLSLFIALLIVMSMGLSFQATASSVGEANIPDLANGL